MKYLMTVIFSLFFLVSFSCEDTNLAKQENQNLQEELMGQKNTDIESMKTEFLEASSKGDYDKVRELLDQGVDVNIKDSEGQTALHLAALNGKINIVRLLLLNGVDIKATDNAGYTAEDIAFSMDYYEIVEILKIADEKNTH